MKEALKAAIKAMGNSNSLSYEMMHAIADCQDALAQPEQEPCGGCGGSGWVPRDPDIGTDQECFVCNGSGAQPEQEPVAYFDWLPKEATHIARIKVKTRSGGRLEMGAYVFKYDNEVLMVYTTDNDNEYPGWREAKQCFYHLNFPVFPIPTTPPKRPWVGLTDEPTYTEQQIANACCAAEISDRKCESLLIALQEAVEAKLKEKNT